MNKTIYIPLDIEEDGKNYLLERGYKLKIAKDVKKETLLKDVQECDAILTRSNATIDADVLDAGKNLKIVSKYGVGLNNIDVDHATSLGVQVTNTPEANANVVAEHVLAMMLTLSKKIMLMDRETRLGNFDIRSEVYSDDLDGKILGVVGLGRIGQLVSHKAFHGFDMKVVGYDPYLKGELSNIQILDSLEQLLRESDFISLHLPLLPTTKHIISTEQFNMMKDSAYLINASRGGTVDEAALAEAIRANKIAGAGIDVFEDEPPTNDNELFTLDKVILTPHSAALSKDGSLRMAVHAAIQVDQVLSGKKPSWPVNNIDQLMSQ